MKTKVAGAIGVAAAMVACMASAALADTDHARKLSEATQVYRELVTSADRGVPQALEQNCKCIAVIPNVLKAAIGIGARSGSGVMSCRQGSSWSPPVFVDIKGGSWGLQLGAESTDLVLFFMSEKGAQSLINGSKISLGGKMSVAAGPFGRSGEASTDLKLKAEIYSYAKSKGLFAGASLEGARMAIEKKDTMEFYGGANPKAILFGGASVNVTAEAEAFRSALP